MVKPRKSGNLIFLFPHVILKTSLLNTKFWEINYGTRSRFKLLILVQKQNQVRMGCDTIVWTKKLSKFYKQRVCLVSQWLWHLLYRQIIYDTSTFEIPSVNAYLCEDDTLLRTWHLLYFQFQFCFKLPQNLPHHRSSCNNDRLQKTVI